MRDKLLYSLICGFILISSAMTYRWYSRNINFPTGDEPHYLVMTDGLVKYGSFEQTKPYQDQFKQQKFYKSSAIKAGDPLITHVNCHAVKGPHGFYNLHNIGLPILLAIPYWLGDILGVRLFMIGLAALILYFTFKIAEQIGQDDQNTPWITFLMGFSAAIVPVSTQIFPDLPAGLFALMGLYWLIHLEKNPQKTFWAKDVFFTTCIAYLPWLNLKLLPTSFIIMAAALFKLFYSIKDRQKAILLGALSCLFWTTIMAYTYYAYGRWMGPYESVEQIISLRTTSVMAFLGLIYDQNQGFLFQNIFYFFGLTGIGLLFRYSSFLAKVWTLVFLSLILPNSFDPEYYGGFSFIGRHQVSAAITFIIPTVFGLSQWFKTCSPLLRQISLSLGVVTHAVFFYMYGIAGQDLYTRGIDEKLISADVYSRYYAHGIQGYLPMLYNVDWAHLFLPNYIWFGIITAVMAYSLLTHYERRYCVIYPRPYALIASFLLISLGTTYYWYTKNINFITGDEPHYLIMTDGLVKHQTLEQTQPYQDHFKNQKFCKGPEKAGDPLVADVNCHAVEGKHGFYNLHNIGLAILLVIPYLIGDVMGVRIFMALLAALVVYFTFRLTKEIHKKHNDILWIAFLICFSASLLPFSTQIFPDLPGGVFSLMGIYWLFMLEKSPNQYSWVKNTLFTCCVAYLPWFHLKMLPTSFILMAAALFKIYTHTKSHQKVLILGTVFSMFWIFILGYTYYAFDNITGGHGKVGRSMVLSLNAIMTFLGLIYDQNQGFLFQNLVFFFGLAGIVPFFRRYPFIAQVWTLVFLSLIVPNSLHPVYYGGVCFIGRYGISAAITFVVPTVFGLSEWFSHSRAFIRTLTLTLGTLNHAAFFYIYAILGQDLYTKGMGETLVDPAVYSRYYPRFIQSYLPMLYSPAWWYRFSPNYIWFVIIVSLITYRFFYRQNQQYRMSPEINYSLGT